MTVPFMPAFHADILWRPVKFVRSGGVFVIGDDNGQIWRCEGDTFEKMAQQIGAASGSHPNVITCGSFALTAGNPTFVLAGYVYKAGGTYTDGKIMTSPDGITWTTAFETTANVDSDTRTPLRMVWDIAANSFFAEIRFHVAMTGTVGGVHATEVWSSPTGHEWAKISSIEAATNPVFDEHCKYKYEFRTPPGIESGSFGLDPAKAGSTDPVPLGKIVPDGLLITNEDLFAVDRAYVGFAGGFWGSGNFDAKFATSSDNGATWQFKGQVAPANISVICAGDL